MRFPGTTPDGFQYPALTARTLDGLKVELQVRRWAAFRRRTWRDPDWSCTVF